MDGRILTCVYCGHEYPQGTPAAGSDVLTEHIKVCERHPMRKAEADIALLRAALVGLVGADSEQELRQMESTMRLLPAPEADKAVSINAIHALLATMTPNLNLQTLAKWVAEIDAITGGAVIELRPGPFGGMKIGVRWMFGKEQYGYEHAMSLSEMERMHDAAQPCVLEQITHAVRRMSPNVEVQGRGAGLPAERPSATTGSASCED